jgi:hypothetical protein
LFLSIFKKGFILKNSIFENYLASNCIYLGKKVRIPRRKIVLAIPNTLDFNFFWKRVREDFQLP